MQLFHSPQFDLKFNSVNNKTVHYFLVYIIILFVSFCIVPTNAQDNIDQKNDDVSTPLIVKLDEIGEKYIRFILWHQIWLSTNNLSNENTSTDWSISLRRSRMIAYAQISPQFLLFTHIGLNSLSPNNLSALGNDGDASQLFLHGAWGEIKILDELHVGGGLHYWKGLTRSANNSTLSFMTMDQSRPFYAWHSLGITDQFARHLGIYAKGRVGKLEYRMAWNTPSRSPLNDGADYSHRFQKDVTDQTSLTYNGVSTPDANGQQKGNTIIEGYFKYNFFDNESIKLPFYTGTYLGKKKVFSVGGGFFYHPDGMYDELNANHRDVAHMAIDAFLDMPIGDNALNAYASYWKFNYE